MIKALGFTGMVFVLVMSVKSAVICVPGDAATIQAGIDLAVDGDTVRIGSGIWRGDGNRDIDVQGKQIVIESGAGPESCIIDIEGTEEELHTGFIFTSNETAETQLIGVTIMHGSGMLVSYSNQDHIRGGAVVVMEASPTIRNCSFLNNNITNNEIFASGGAVFIYKTGSLISNCKFQDNFASKTGSAVLCESSPSGSIIESSFFFNNVCSQGTIACYTSSINIVSCTFAENRVNSVGGAILIMSDDEIERSRIEGCFFIGNSVRYDDPGQYSGAGAVYCNKTDIVDCMFVNNSAGEGGAITCYYNTRIFNCLLANNSAIKGGAIYCSTAYYEYCDVSHSTFVNNISNSVGGAIYIPQLLSPITVTNCIFRNNYPSQIEPSNGDPDELPDVTYCNVEGGYRGYRNIDVDPLFCSDGPDRFFLSQIASGQSQDSPCLDKGNTDASLACVPESDPPICMDAFTTRTDRITDAGTVDMGFHYPPDWTGSTITGVRLWMPETVYHPGDPCACKVFVYNRDEQPLDGHALFVVLDILGAYYFAPSFTEYDSYLGDYPSFPIGRTEILVIPEFVWPTGTGSFSGAMFYAAMLDPTLTQVVGNWDWFQFGWGE